MNTPEPNSPYAQQPHPAQPYGGQPYGTQSYGTQPYGAAQPYGYPGDGYAPYAPAPQMPRGIKASRIILFILGGLYTVLGPLLLAAASVVGGDGRNKDLTPGVMYVSGGLTLVVGIAALVVASRFGKGGNGVRIAAVVIAAIIIGNGLLNLAMGQITFVAGLASGIALLVNCLKKDGVEWFKRPRH
ncbi:hypothetical protein [Streptomyces sp. NPDC002537]